MCTLPAVPRWLGLRVRGRLALFYIYYVNQVKSRKDLVRDDSTVNMVIGNGIHYNNRYQGVTMGQITAL